MKKFIQKHKVILFISFSLLIWRLFLFILEENRFAIPLKPNYLGQLLQANFDGVYYTAISQYWYRGLDQAFFPAYPIVIKIVSFVTFLQPATAGVIVSILSLVLFLRILHALMNVDGLKKYSFWAIVLYLSFPTSFFFAAVYTESLFLFFTLLSFYLIRKEHRYGSVIAAACASGTRIIGIFLLPSLFLEFLELFKQKKKKYSFRSLFLHFFPLIFVPLGLVGYMVFLLYKYKDPLMFVHIQPYFGAGRSGGGIVLLPQVLYRYLKILMSVSPTSFTFSIAILELFVLVLSSVILFLAYKKGLRKSYILFACFAVFFPTLSGTLSSLPRYVLVCFVIFMYVSSIKNSYIKIIVASIGILLQAVLATYFLNGYFVS